MKKGYKKALMCLAFLCILPTHSLASHPDIALKDHSGDVIVNSGTPYSPKMTCAGCHFDCDTLSSTTISDEYCQTTPEQLDCNVNDCPDYGFGDHTSIHTQGVQNGDGEIFWQAEETLSYAHGIQASRHVNTGRNEDYTKEHREARGDSFFTNSPGMFGKW